jgi:leader peptidase (prepilin peptidase)/N-methyltransferase
MEFIILLYLGLIGAAMGSFAGAVAWRLEKGRDFVRERSECEHCHHVLSPKDLIPVVSWLWLGGKCRYCKKPIGVSAVALEVALGLAFALSFLVWPYGFEALGVALFVAWLMSLVALAILFVYDMRHFLLPDVIVWPLAVLGGAIFIFRMLIQEVSVEWWLVEAVLALIPITGLYGLLYAISGGKWIGFGDVKLGVFIGLALGWQYALIALLLANYLGFFWVLPKLLRGKLSKASHMPFGPFLIVAAFVAFLWGEILVRLFLDFLII